MRLSVFDPIQPAIAHAKLVCFDPFDFGKWLRLGFCAFLMGLASASGGSPGGGGGRPRGDNGPDFDPAVEWLREHFATIVVVVLVVVALIFVFAMLLTWLSSRGHFMFVDGVVNNRGLISEPWNEYRAEGNSLFRFRLCLALIGLVVVVGVMGLSAMMAWPDIQQGEFGGAIVSAIVCLILAMIAFGLTMAIIGIFLKDFVVPVMYLRRIPVMAAWGEFNRSMLSGNGMTFVLYLVARFVISLAVGVISMGVICATCCIAALPYISSVALLPLYVFLQAYPLYFIEQFGPDWQVFGRANRRHLPTTHPRRLFKPG